MLKSLAGQSEKMFEIFEIFDRKTVKKTNGRRFRRSSREYVPRLPIEFFGVIQFERNIKLFYQFLVAKHLEEEKTKMEFILAMQNLYRMDEISDEVVTLFDEYFGRQDRLRTGWMRKMLLERQVQKDSKNPHVFDSVVAKCIESVQPALCSFVDYVCVESLENKRL